MKHNNFKKKPGHFINKPESDTFYLYSQSPFEFRSLTITLVIS